MANIQIEIMFYECTLTLLLPFPYKILLMVLGNSGSSASSGLRFFHFILVGRLSPSVSPRSWLLECDEL